jgi:hypothetical protein
MAKSVFTQALGAVRVSPNAPGQQPVRSAIEVLAGVGKRRVVKNDVKNGPNSEARVKFGTVAAKTPVSKK